MEKNNSLFKSIIIVLLLWLPIYAFSFENRLKFYEIGNKTNFDELETYVMTNGLKRNREYYINGDGSIDSLAYYDTEDWKHAVTIIYSPKTHILSTYRYRWRFDESFEDEFTNQTNSTTNSYKMFPTKYSSYYVSVFQYLCKKYGKPTSVMVNDRPGYTTNYRYIVLPQQLDTLDYQRLISDYRHFEIYWDDGKRKVTFMFFDGDFSYVQFEFEYLNYNNYFLQRNDINSIQKDEKIKSIATIVVIVIIILIILGVIIRYIHKVNVQDENDRKLRAQRQAEQYAIEKQKELEFKKQKELEYERLVTEHENYISTLTKQYGSCDKSLKLTSDREDIYNKILVFSNSKHITINQKTYTFSDILDCTVNDDVKEKDTVETYRSPSIATTSTNNGNLLKRAAIGGILLGNAGAIIGGSTAKKETTVEYGKDTTIHNREITHNYTVVVTVKDIKSPNLLINVGNNTKLKDEIMSLFRVIISMK